LKENKIYFKKKTNNHLVLEHSTEPLQRFHSIMSSLSEYGSAAMCDSFVMP